MWLRDGGLKSTASWLMAKDERETGSRPCYDPLIRTAPQPHPWRPGDLRSPVAPPAEAEAYRRLRYAQEDTMHCARGTIRQGKRKRGEDSIKDV